MLDGHGHGEAGHYRRRLGPGSTWAEPGRERKVLDMVGLRLAEREQWCMVVVWHGHGMGVLVQKWCGAEGAKVQGMALGVAEGTVVTMGQMPGQVHCIQIV